MHRIVQSTAKLQALTGRLTSSPKGFSWRGVIAQPLTQGLGCGTRGFFSL